MKLMLKQTFLISAMVISCFLSLYCNNHIVKGNNQTKVSDTLRVIVKIKNVLPIGWGTKYKCDVLKVIKGELTSIDSTFVMSASVGSEAIFKDIDFLKTDEYYDIEFVKSTRKSDKPYIPAGTTGLMDKVGIIWDIINLKLAH